MTGQRSNLRTLLGWYETTLILSTSNMGLQVKDISADGVPAMDAPTPVEFSGTQAT